MEDAKRETIGGMLLGDRRSLDEMDAALTASMKKLEALAQKVTLPEEKLEILCRENLEYAPFVERYPRLPLVISIIALLVSILRQFLP